MNAKNVWDELSDDERKQVSFYLLNRYVSAIKGKIVFPSRLGFNVGYYVITILQDKPIHRIVFQIDTIFTDNQNLQKLIFQDYRITH